MLGLSFSKLVLLVLVVLAVWYGWKYVGRVNEVREAIRRQARRRDAGPARSLKAEDMIRCRVCDAFVTSGAASCGRPDCPF